MERKVIVITGATGGLGSEMVKHFEQQNVRLALHTFQHVDNKIKKNVRRHVRWILLERVLAQ